MTINPLKVVGVITTIGSLAFDLAKDHVESIKLYKVIDEKVAKAVAEALKERGL